MKSSERLVLVVDDEDDIRTYLSAVLSDAGFRVVQASSGKEALEAVKRERPDFISLDLVMPGGSGIAFLHELRRHREWVNIPVTVLTGHARDELGKADLAKALEGKLLSGPHAYLEKPVTPERYVAAVREILGIDSSGAASSADAADEGAMREKAAALLRDATPEKLAEVLGLLGRT